MANCLVKRLKGVVDNDNLPKYGCISIKMNTIENITNEWQLRLAAKMNGRISASPGGYFANSYADLSDPSKTFTSLAINGSKTLYVKNGDYTIFLEGRYGGIENLYFSTGDSSSPSNYTFNIDELKYNDSLVNIDAVNCSKISGELKNIVKPNIVDVTMYGTSTTGNILDFIGCPDLAHLYCPTITNFSDKPNIIEFVAGQVNNGKTSNTTGIEQYSAWEYERFGNTDVMPHVSAFGRLKWTSASHITFEYTSGSAANTILAYGATAEEIAAWEAEGKTVIVVN